jgi:hypothetical protein
MLARRRGFSRFLFFFLAIQQRRPVEAAAAGDGSPAAEKLGQQTGRKNQQG